MITVMMIINKIINKTSTVVLLDVFGDIKQTSRAQTQHVILGVMMRMIIMVMVMTIIIIIIIIIRIVMLVVMLKTAQFSTVICFKNFKIGRNC